MQIMQSLLTLYHPHRKDSVPDSHQLSISIFYFTCVYFSDKNGLVSSVPSCSFIPLPKPDCSSIFPWLPWQSPFSHLFVHSVNKIRELTWVKNQKYKTCWLISFPDHLPSEFTVQNNTRMSVLDQSTGPFGLVSCPSSRAGTADVLWGRMLGQGKNPGMLSQPPVTCDSGMSWVKVNVFTYNIHWWNFLSFMFLMVLDFF